MSAVRRFCKVYASHLDEATAILFWQDSEARKSTLSSTSTTCIELAEGVLDRHDEGETEQLGANVFLCSAEALPEVELSCFTRVLIPTTLEDAAGYHFMTLASERLKATTLCAIAVLLLPTDVCFNSATNGVLLDRFGVLAQMGFDEVMSDPLPHPDAFREAVRSFARMAGVTNKRLNHILDMEASPCDERRLRQLKLQHKDVIWRQIPTLLMRHFPPLDRNLVETELQIGNYTLLKHIPGLWTMSLVARHRDTNELNMLKVIDKASVDDARTLEGIYREYRLLNCALEHEGVIRCEGGMHSDWRLYYIFEYAGETSLAKFVGEFPGQRLPVPSALHYFGQVANALMYLHDAIVALRAMSHETIMLKPGPGHRRICKIVDFSHATYCKAKDSTISGSNGNKISNVSVSLPFFAPEVALGEPYMPLAVDAWLAGLLLLEIAGGLRSLEIALGIESMENVAEVAQVVCNWFHVAGSHARALSAAGNVRDAVVEAILRMLLKIPGESRANMSSVVFMLDSRAQEPDD